MKILLSPQVRFDAQPMVLSREGDTLTINGEAVALQTEPVDDTPLHPALVSWPHRDEGEWVVTLLYPIAPDASEADRFPAPMEVTGDGVIEMPGLQLA